MILLIPEVKREREGGLFIPVSNGIGNGLPHSISRVDLGHLPASPTASGEAPASSNTVFPPSGETPHLPLPPSGALS